VRLKQNSTLIEASPPVDDSDSIWEIEYDDLAFLEKIGEGAYGIVFKAKWNQRLVAVKKLKESVESVSQFRKEIGIMSAMRPHENVLRLFGICSKALPYCIVTPFIEGGTLEYLLTSRINITTTQTLTIVIRVAEGLHHLHSEKIVHRDLTSRNILLKVTDKGWSPIIGDFGLSRNFSNKNGPNLTKSNTGPLKIMAPECLVLHQYSFASDVWSFAVLLETVYTRNEPYPGIKAFAVATKVGRGDLFPNIPPNMPTKLQKISRECSKYEPSLRITMKQVCDKLEEIIL